MGNVLSFAEFVNEKMGVILRHKDENNFKDDELGINSIINDFLGKLENNPDDSYEKSYELLGIKFSISYQPAERIGHSYLEKDTNTIVVTTRYTHYSISEIKKIIIHEITHLIQYNTGKRKEKGNVYDELIHTFAIAYVNYMNDMSKATKEDTNIFNMLYRQNKDEYTAYLINIYSTVYYDKCTNKTTKNVAHRNRTDKQIIHDVLKHYKLSNSDLDNAISKIKKCDKEEFPTILGFLVAQFSEITSKAKSTQLQPYFDKTVFKLDVVKKLKKEVKELLDKEKDVNDEKTLRYALGDIFEKYEDELYKHKDVICDSFIDHFKYYFNKAKSKAMKAIQLAFDDYEENTNEKEKK